TGSAPCRMGKRRPSDGWSSVCMGLLSGHKVEASLTQQQTGAATTDNLRGTCTRSNVRCCNAVAILTGSFPCNAALRQTQRRRAQCCGNPALHGRTIETAINMMISHSTEKATARTSAGLCGVVIPWFRHCPACAFVMHGMCYALGVGADTPAPARS